MTKKLTLPIIERTTLILDVADELELSHETVRRDVNRGAPHSRIKGGKIVLNVPEYTQWRQAHNLTGERGRPAEVSSPGIEAARLRKENALASKYELQVARERGEMVPTAEVREWIGQHVTAAKNRLIGLGAAITPHLEGRDAAERQTIIDTRINEILNELAAA